MRIVYYFQITHQRDYDNTVEEQNMVIEQLLQQHNMQLPIKETQSG